MGITSRVKQIVKPVAHHLGIGVTTIREGLAMRRTRINTASRLAGAPARVAIVGCGGMGRTIAKAVGTLDRWSIGGICDTNAATAESFRADVARDATIYAAYDEMLVRANEWDILIVATTAPAHVPLASKAIAAGVRALLVEKPVSNSLQEADNLVREAEKAGTRVSVDHVRRWMGGGDGVRRLIASGIIGKPIAMHFTASGAGLSMIGTHLFDYARWIMGADIARLRADLDDVIKLDHRGPKFVDRSGRCEAYLTNGVRITLDLSDRLPMQHGHCLIVGEFGRLEVDERLGRIRMVASGGRSWEEEYVYPGAITQGVAAALFELKSGRKTRCTLQDGRAALEAAIACQVSAREEQRWVVLPLTGAVREEVFPFA